MTLERLESEIEDFESSLGNANEDMDAAAAYFDKKLKVYDFVKEALSDSEMFPGGVCECPDNFEPYCVEGGSPLHGYLDCVTKLSLKNGIVWASGPDGSRICYMDIFSYEGMVVVAYYLVASQHPDVDYNEGASPWKERYL